MFTQPVKGELKTVPCLLRVTEIERGVWGEGGEGGKGEEEGERGRERREKGRREEGRGREGCSEYDS